MKALNAHQQDLLMQFYKLTAGRGYHWQTKAQKPTGKRDKQLHALKAEMLRAGVPTELLYAE